MTKGYIELNVHNMKTSGRCFININYIISIEHREDETILYMHSTGNTVETYFTSTPDDEVKQLIAMAI